MGIIFFEMCHKPFETVMERHQVITALRTPHVVIPNEMLNNPATKKQVNVLKWLLVHDQAVRPFAEQLLSSDLMPPAQLEASELQEMLRHALANSQSKAYKNLVARCLAQKSDTVLELTYHLGLVPSNTSLKTVKVTFFARNPLQDNRFKFVFNCASRTRSSRSFANTAAKSSPPRCSGRRSIR